MQSVVSCNRVLKESTSDSKCETGQLTGKEGVPRGSRDKGRTAAIAMPLSLQDRSCGRGEERERERLSGKIVCVLHAGRGRCFGEERLSNLAFCRFASFCMLAEAASEGVSENEEGNQRHVRVYVCATVQLSCSP